MITTATITASCYACFRQLAIARSIDRFEDAITAARAVPSPGGSGRVPYFLADVTSFALAKAEYDYISCLAIIHHMPFATVAVLREALAPGGVLVMMN